MSSLEQLVYARLAAEPAVAALLPTVDGGDPAIFAEQAPDSSSRRWDDAAEQIPRVVITLERTVDPTRGSDASLLVDLYGSSAVLPELSVAVVASLGGVYWHPDGEPPLATRMRSANPDPALAEFAGTDDALNLAFDVLAFPEQPALAPDPIERLYQWAATVEGAGYDEPAVQAEPGSWSAEAEPPALYVSMRNQSLVKRWPLKLQWLAEVRMHVLHADATVRNTAVRRLLQALATTPVMRLGSGYMYVDRPMSADLTADPLRLGQLSAQVEFFTTPSTDVVPRIMRVVFLREDVGLGQFIPPELEV